MGTEKTEKTREYNKEKYKVKKVYIDKEEVKDVENHIKKKKMSFNDYVKKLIDEDMQNTQGGGI